MTVLEQLNSALAERYDIEREIGRGGMATVYLAQDLRHGRHVALKVLDPELGAVLGVERFLAEIRVTAKLQHPNLLPLFDSGAAAGLLFYVMPFVEGESLRVRLDREKQLPVDEAVRIATAAASALDYAHRQGVIHRDLKPENILLHEGQPLVADFGIALAVSKAGGARVTQTGLSLGTPMYMSPEQATGDRAIDSRTDIYSLGAVTYEMLTGEPPHTGSTSQAIIARLMTEEPRPLTTIRRAVPVHVDQAVRHALEKLPADRFATAAQFCDALQGRGTMSREYASGAHTPSPRSRVMSYLPWALFAGAALLAALLLSKAEETSSEPIVTQLLPPEGHTFVDAGFAIARNGRQLVFVARAADGSTALWLQHLDSLDAARLAGTEGAVRPFWAPDGDQIGFFSRGALRTVAVNGGSLRELCPAASPNGGDWSKDGTIVYHPARGSPLHRVSAEGGECRPIGSEPGGRPSFLPGGRYVLSGGRGILDTESATVVPLPPRIPAAEHVFVAPHYILFPQTQNGSLYSIPIRLPSGAPTGPPRLLLPRISTPRGTLALSATARVLIANMPRGGSDRLAWVNRQGEIVDSSLSRGGWSAALSNNGRRLVTGGFGMILHDLSRGTHTKLHVESIPGQRQATEHPVWSPGDSLIAYAKGGTPLGLWMYRVSDGSRMSLFESGNRRIIPSDWSHDGRTIVYTVLAGDSVPRDEIWQYDVKTREKRLVFSSAASVSGGQLAPGGRWLAYVSNETGRREVYLRPYPGPGASVPISTAGGHAPRWGSDGSELFFIAPGGTVMTVATSALPRVGDATMLFRSIAEPSESVFSVTPDGQRFLLYTPGPLANRALTVIQNWPARVNRKN